MNNNKVFYVLYDTSRSFEFKPLFSFTTETCDRRNKDSAYNNGSFYASESCTSVIFRARRKDDVSNAL